MEDKTKQKLFTLLYILLIVVVIGTCIFMINFIRGEAGECLADPIQYYSEKTNQLCYCNNGLGWANAGVDPIDNINFKVIP